MNETPAGYQTATTADAIRNEAAAVKDAAGYLLGVVSDMNFPARPANFWRCVVQSVYERLSEAVE